MDVICLGEALIDFFAAKSGVKLSEVDTFCRVAGGAPANVAVGVSKLGLKSAFIGRVGNDEFGHFLERTLKENSVDISQMQFDDNVRTGLAFVSVPTPNTREFLFYRNPSSDMMIDYREFDRAFLKITKVFHYGSITLGSKKSKTSTYKAIKLAKSGKAIISYDPNLRLNLWPSAKEARLTIMEAIPFSDIIKVNDEELYFITGGKNLVKAMKKILLMGPKVCLVTMGAEGCAYSTLKYNGHFPAFKVNTVDATGCGDSFVSGVLAGLVEGEFKKIIEDEKKIINILKTASAAAAITSIKKGVIPALPFRSDVEKFLLKLK